MIKKIIIALVYLATLLSVPILVIINATSVPYAVSIIFILEVLIRIMGLMGLVLLFWQIIVGAYLLKFSVWMGEWISKFHFRVGIITYLVILLHPVLLLVSRYFSKHLIDPFSIFTDMCVFCETKPELFLTFGKISLWVLSAMVIAAIFRKTVGLLNKWYKLHLLNYPVFLLISAHALTLGKDVTRIPFIGFYLLAVLIVIIVAILRVAKIVKENILVNTP